MHFLVGQRKRARQQDRVEKYTYLRGVRISWLMLDRNCRCNSARDSACSLASCWWVREDRERIVSNWSLSGVNSAVNCGRSGGDHRREDQCKTTPILRNQPQNKGHKLKKKNLENNRIGGLHNLKWSVPVSLALSPSLE